MIERAPDMNAFMRILMDELVEMQGTRCPGTKPVEPMERHPTRTEYKDGKTLRFRWPLIYRLRSLHGPYGRPKVAKDGWYWQSPVYIEHWFTMRDVLL